MERRVQDILGQELRPGDKVWISHDSAFIWFGIIEKITDSSVIVDDLQCKRTHDKLGMTLKFNARRKQYHKSRRIVRREFSSFELLKVTVEQEAAWMALPLL